MNNFIFDNKRWRTEVAKEMVIRNYSIRTLAEKMPFSATHLHRLVSGKREPKMSEFIQICSILKLPAIEFFDEEEYQLRMF